MTRDLLFFVRFVLFVVQSLYTIKTGSEQQLVTDRVWKLFSLNHGDFVLE